MNANFSHRQIDIPASNLLAPTKFIEDLSIHRKILSFRDHHQRLSCVREQDETTK